MATKPSTSKRLLFWVLLLTCVGYGLQHFPGSYAIVDFQDDFELTSPEGVALLALSGVSLDSELYFKHATRHRISRNAEILVPGETTLRVSASMIPFILKDKVVASPKTLVLTSDKPLTFIYRFVTVAEASILQISPDDPDEQVKAIGHYKILTALATAYRYKRQKEVKRSFHSPTKARLTFRAEILPNHEIITEEGYSTFTGSHPGVLSVENAVWDETHWQEGTLSLSLNFSDVDPLVEQLVTELLPEDVEIGNLFNLKVKQIYDLRFSKNGLTFYVKGSLSPSASKRVANIFTPSFTTNLGIEFTFPKETLISDAKAGVELKNIYSLDFNRSNPLFDKTARDMVRRYRGDAKALWELGKEFQILNKLPGNFYIQEIEIDGDENGYPTLTARIEILPSLKTSF